MLQNKTNRQKIKNKKKKSQSPETKTFQGTFTLKYDIVYISKSAGELISAKNGSSLNRSA